MKKAIILRKIQVTMKIFVPEFLNHLFHFEPEQKKCVVIRAMRKKQQKESFADILQNRCS